MKRGYICYSSYLLFKGIVNQYNRVSEFLSFCLMLSIREYLAGDFKQEHDRISLLSVMILAHEFFNCWAGAWPCRLQGGFLAWCSGNFLVLWTVLATADLGAFFLGTLNCIFCGILPVSLESPCFPKLEPSFVFSSVPWMFAKVCQVPGSVLPCDDPETNR